MTLEEKAEKYARNYKYESAPFYGIMETYLAGANEVKADCDFVLEGKDVEIKELKDGLEACKFAMSMSEKVEKQLREQIEKMKCCANCKSFKGYGETCEGWGEPVLNLNCDCTEWELKEIEK